jgi:hypothetical protein
MPAPVRQRSLFSTVIINPGPVTREHVNVRAHELAVIAGRAPPHVTQADYEQAKREVTGESDLERQEAMLNSASAPG